MIPDSKLIRITPVESMNKSGKSFNDSIRNKGIINSQIPDSDTSG